MIVIIPAHNEANNIAELISRTKAAVPHAEILVVDDGSTDDTYEVAGRNGARVFGNPEGAEYGDGFRIGLILAYNYQHNFAIFIDAGLSHSPEEIPRLLEALSEHDVVIGSRFVNGAVYRQRFCRKILTYLAIGAYALAGRKMPMDYSSFRAFSLGAVKQLLDEGIVDKVWSKRAHAFNPQLLYLMRAKGFNITQVPITYVATTSSLNLRGFLEAIVGLVNVAMGGRKLSSQ